MNGRHFALLGMVLLTPVDAWLLFTAYRMAWKGDRNEAPRIHTD